MTRFALLRNIDALPALMDGLDAWARVRSPRAAPARPLVGLWIAHPDEAPGPRDAVAMLDDGPARLRLLMGTGPWSIGVTSAALSRAELLDALAVAWGAGGHTRARFVPVYQPSDGDGVLAEWQRLASRHPGLVLPPMVCDSAGRLQCVEPPTDVEVAVPAVRNRSMSAWLQGLA